MGVRGKFGDSTLNSGRIIRLLARPDPFYGLAADQKQLLRPKSYPVLLYIGYTGMKVRVKFCDFGSKSNRSRDMQLLQMRDERRRTPVIT